MIGATTRRVYCLRGIFSSIFSGIFIRRIYHRRSIFSGVLRRARYRRDSRGIPGSNRCRPVEGGEEPRDKRHLAHLHAENIKNTRSAQFVSLLSAVRILAKCGS